MKSKDIEAYLDARTVTACQSPWRQRTRRFFQISFEFLCASHGKAHDVVPTGFLTGNLGFCRAGLENLRIIGRFRSVDTLRMRILAELKRNQSQFHQHLAHETRAEPR